MLALRHQKALGIWSISQQLALKRFDLVAKKQNHIAEETVANRAPCLLVLAAAARNEKTRNFYTDLPIKALDANGDNQAAAVDPDPGNRSDAAAIRRRNRKTRCNCASDSPGCPGSDDAACRWLIGRK